MTDADSLSSASPITIVQSSPDISTESHSVGDSSETSTTRLTFTAGLLPAFEMLMTRLKEVGQHGEENETRKTQNVARSLFSNNPASRLALSTIQAYGSTESQPNLPTFSKPILNQIKTSSNSKRQRRSSSPVNRKKAKYGKLNSGVGHGIRKPKPQTKSDKNQHGTLSSGSSKSNGSPQFNLKLQAIKNKLNKNKVKSDVNTSTKSESGWTAETWEDNEEYSMELTEIVDNLDLCTDDSDNINVNQEKFILMQTEEEICKINELIQVVQGDGGKDFLPSSSPSRNFAELVPVDQAKIQEVENLLDKLFSDEPLPQNNEQLVSISEILSTQKESKSHENQSAISDNESDVSKDIQNDMNISDVSDSPCIALESPSQLSQQNLQDLENLVDKLNQSDYIDPDDSDPFSEYNDDESSLSNGSEEKESINKSSYKDTEGNSIICDIQINANHKTENNTDSIESHLKIKPTKLFPVFMKEKVPDKISEQRSSPLKQSNTQIRRNFPVQEKDGKEQLLLDAGQKKFGLVVCEVCQFHYDPDVRNDVEAHFFYHNRHETHPKHMGWKNERVVANYEKDGRILMVKAGDPSSWWRRVATILETVNYDLGFKEEMSLCENNSKVFLYVWQKNIVGCIVSEHITSANRMLPGSQDLCTEEYFPALCGISRIWTSKTLRRKGFASKLMNAVRTNFLSSRDVSRSEIAFSSPTPDGRAFATKYLGSDTFLVY